MSKPVWEYREADVLNLNYFCQSGFRSDEWQCDICDKQYSRGVKGYFRHTFNICKSCANAIARAVEREGK